MLFHFPHKLPGAVPAAFFAPPAGEAQRDGRRVRRHAVADDPSGQSAADDREGLGHLQRSPPEALPPLARAQRRDDQDDAGEWKDQAGQGTPTGEVLQQAIRVAGQLGRIDSLRRRYIVSYTSTNPVNDGMWRTVEIRPRRDGLAVAAQAGYFAPDP